MDHSGSTIEYDESMETLMASKDKGGKSTKKVAAKDLKQKRQDKKAKREAKPASDRAAQG